ncbi:uncharacterized protein LOC143231786 isoform X1 [Tachypleus tridentatus]|uniref:uncharacterized protein LOC143231786 isoform X1 n=1 Tax=Tachypleus tridentatus TaxID=6853 RepID=UPI003FCF0FE9
MNTVPLCYILSILVAVTVSIDYETQWENMNIEDNLFSLTKSSDELSHNEMGEYDMDNSEINKDYKWDTDHSHHFHASYDHHFGHDMHSKEENSSNEPWRNEMDKHDTHESTYRLGKQYNEREPKTGNSDENNNKLNHDHDNLHDFNQDSHHAHDDDGHKYHEEHENEHAIRNEAGSFHKTIPCFVVASCVVLMK